MTRIVTASIGFALAGAVLVAAGACSKNKEPPACQDLLNCCADLGGATSSCTATAMSGELDDAACGQELETYVSTGQCPGPGKSPTTEDAAVADAPATD